MGKPYKWVLCTSFLGKSLSRKARFWVGLLLVVFIYALPLYGFALTKAYAQLALTLAGFALSVYLVHRYTIRNVKPRYPLVSPEGHPDIYTGRMPRPIYEDMERYSWFFRKKRAKKLESKKVKRKH
jgi:hypothetical protein